MKKSLNEISKCRIWFISFFFLLSIPENRRNCLLFLIVFLFLPPLFVGFAANGLAVHFPRFWVIIETLLTTTRAFIARMVLFIVIPQGAITMKRLRFALGAVWEDTSIECLQVLVLGVLFFLHYNY